MKKIVASVGLVALSASSLQAVEAAMPSDSGRFWSVNLALRGFYDDNINTLPNDQPTQPGYSRASAGFEVSPGIFFNVPLEQTSFGLSYVYDFKYYDNKPQGQTENYDQTHVFEAAVNHAFNERYQISAKDSFVIGQEPDMLRAGNTYNTFQRIPGDNLRNYGVLNFAAQITPLLGAEIGYGNTLFDYADDAPVINYNSGQVVSPSNAGLLNEMDQVAHLDARLQILPQTIGILGYQFRYLDYTGGQPIGGNLTGVTTINGVAIPDPVLMSNIRNFYANYLYLGLDHNFRPDLTGSIRAGGSYNVYYNNDSSQNSLAPYALISLRWTYNPRSYLEAGFTYDFTTGSAFDPSNRQGNLTLGAYAASLYATLHHQITGKLAGSIIAQIQNDDYYGGSFDNEAQNYFLLYLGLEYQFNRYLSATIGYDYDNVWGDIASQVYDRNRVYIGVTANY
jgi:hypothetical protein